MKQLFTIKITLDTLEKLEWNNVTHYEIRPDFICIRRLGDHVYHCFDRVDLEGYIIGVEFINQKGKVI